jgi:hypothetical protein
VTILRLKSSALRFLPTSSVSQLIDHSLRQAADTSLATLNLGPPSSPSRLAAIELGGSLSWTLVNCFVLYLFFTVMTGFTCSCIRGKFNLLNGAADGTPYCARRLSPGWAKDDQPRR